MPIEKIAIEVANLLKENNITVSVAESCTGGLVSSMLTDISGSSAYISLNMITYSNDSKIKMLNISEDIINNFGAVSEQTAALMSANIRIIANTDIGLGITGIAGPEGGTFEKPVGLVYIGISDEKNTQIYKINIDSAFQRTHIKQEAAINALNSLKIFIENIFYVNSFQ